MTDHLSAEDLASHLDGVLPPGERTRVDQHLAECHECRAELIAASRVLRTKPGRRRWFIPTTIAAAAAAAVLVLWRSGTDDTFPPQYREPAVSTTPAPIGLAPRGVTAAPVRLIWTRVPHAERYRLTVFDSTGAVLWESQTTDTSIAVPRSVQLRPRAPYFWQVEAQTSWNRSIKSDVVEFSRP